MRAAFLRDAPAEQTSCSRSNHPLDLSALVDITGLDLRGLDLSGLDLRGLDLRGLDLRGLDLRGLD
jgi:uncharacterized protein YjbI with pentapeptide repeats